MNTIRIEGKVEEVTSRTFDGNTVVNVKLHDVVNNEHNVYFDIPFWNEDAAKALKLYKTGDTVGLTGKLKVRPYTANDGGKNLTLVVYDVTNFVNIADKFPRYENLAGYAQRMTEEMAMQLESADDDVPFWISQDD